MLNEKILRNISLCFRQVELGETDINRDPDCKYCPKKITAKITNPGKQIIAHENFDPITGANDIALIRLNEPITLFSDDPLNSLVAPVCLPWKKDDAARNLADMKKTLITGWGKTQNSTIDNENEHLQGDYKRMDPLVLNHCNMHFYWKNSNK